MSRRCCQPVRIGWTASTKLVPGDEKGTGGRGVSEQLWAKMHARNPVFHISIDNGSTFITVTIEDCSIWKVNVNGQRFGQYNGNNLRRTFWIRRKIDWCISISSKCVYQQALEFSINAEMYIPAAQGVRSALKQTQNYSLMQNCEIMYTSHSIHVCYLSEYSEIQYLLLLIRFCSISWNGHLSSGWLRQHGLSIVKTWNFNKYILITCHLATRSVDLFMCNTEASAWNKSEASLTTILVDHAGSVFESLWRDRTAQEQGLNASHECWLSKQMNVL